MFDITTDTAVLLVHVGSATMLVGSSLFMPLVHRFLLAADSLEAVRLWLAFGRRASRTNPVVALVVLGTGVYLGSLGWWTQAWFSVAAGAWLLNTLLAALVVGRTAAALGAAVGPRQGAVDPAVDRLRRAPAWRLANGVMRASDLAMIYVMFVKPTLLECLLVLAVAVGLSLGAARVERC